VPDEALALRLRSELSALLATPLHQRVNARFFTGGSAQPVAAALVAAGGPAEQAPAADGKREAPGEHACDRKRRAQDGDVDTEGSGAPRRDKATSVPLSALRESVALAETLVASRSQAAARTQAKGKREGAPASGKRKRGAASLAECRAAALERAVADKRRRKAGAAKTVRV
jgi:hypothetical protein